MGHVRASCSVRAEVPPAKKCVSSYLLIVVAKKSIYIYIYIWNPLGKITALIFIEILGTFCSGVCTGPESFPFLFYL